MKRILVAILLVITMAVLTGCSDEWNAKNAISRKEADAPIYFIHTGASVRNHQYRIYDVVKDKYGWLYLCSDIEGNLIPILDSEGKPTQDLSVVTE